jgi:hypothetical protein
MKKPVRLLALIGILGVTAWLGPSRNANAAGGGCADLDGSYCYPEGATTQCQRWGAPFTGTCFCSGESWICN